MELSTEHIETRSRDWSFESSRSFDLGVIFAGAAFTFALISVSYKHIHLNQLNHLMENPNGADFVFAFLGGVLAALFAIYSLMTYADVTVSVLPSRNLLSIRRRYLTHTATENYHFNSISGILGRESAAGGRRSYIYRLSFRLKDGRVIQSGKQSFNENEIVQLANRLISDIGCSDANDLPFALSPVTSKKIVISAIGAIVFYICFYRIHLGKLCSAMWVGAPPFVVIGFSFASILVLTRRFMRD